jgi:para-nitrobenzyl esterase
VNPDAEPTTPAYDPSELDVEVTGGTVRGVRERGIEAWRGIPYAAPPRGDLRFRAPQPVEGWQGARFAQHFGRVAPQVSAGAFMGAPQGTPMGEDCLTVNVIAPSGLSAGAARVNRESQLRPVMVFIHGGAYVVGSSRENPVQGEGLVRQGGIVYVSFNYRLGALGYLDFSRYSTPERPIESNLGLRDQVRALEWVRDNIRAFGGDPGNVTVFGESAGGNAGTAMRVVTAAHGLFARAIAQSSPTNAIYPAEQTARWAEQFVGILADRAGRAPDDAEAVRLLTAASSSTLAAAANELMVRTPDQEPGTITFSPVIDGDVLPERPLDAFKHGRAARVPLIIGTNEREGSLFTGRLDILATTPERIRAVFAKTDEASREELAALYPGLPKRRAALDFGGDYAFWFPSIKVAERHARYAPVHFYRFDIAPRLVRLMGLDATHGLELFALFDRMDSLVGRGMTLLGGRRAFVAAGERMRIAWLRFAQDGSVDESWPPYVGDDEDALRDLDEDDDATAGTGSAAERGASHPGAAPRARIRPGGIRDSGPRRRATYVFDVVDRVEHDPHADRRVAWRDFVPHI